MTNLLLNPGFETWTVGNPDSWWTWQSGTKAVFTYPEVPGANGTGKCTSISYPTAESGAEADISQIVAIDHTKIYTISGKMNVVSVSSSTQEGASISVDWHNNPSATGSPIRTDRIILKTGTVNII